jgi:hypothetical protein
VIPTSRVTEETGELWVFLGDSLTEGVGYGRVSYVSELVQMLRRTQRRAVHEIRLRTIEPAAGSFGLFNLAGYLNADKCSADWLWIWNLSSEGTTIQNDLDLIGLIHGLRPTRTFVLRGALESIVRPPQVANGLWPIWVPRSWRYYAAMDPRCYFSTTWWRRGKQKLIDYVKQATRLKLLRGEGRPLLSSTAFRSYFIKVLDGLIATGSEIIVLALPPVSERTFPGSLETFRARNQLLRMLTQEMRIEFFDWHHAIASAQEERELLFLDGFHPNVEGAEFMASLLTDYLTGRRPNCRNLW